MVVFSVEVWLDLVGPFGGDVSKGVGCHWLHDVAETMGGGNVDKDSAVITEYVEAEGFISCGMDRAC